MQICGDNNLEADLPGFRFHPTEQELIEYYLSRVAHGKSLKSEIIRMINIYRYDPWDLPEMAFGEREWYFFVRLDKKNGGNNNSGGRPNRTTERGFWKATGSDRKILRASEPRHLIGIKKTLVYYKGRAPRGTKTDWVMNEYRLPDKNRYQYGATLQDDIVLCKIYRKAKSMKELEQRAAMDQINPVSFEEASSSTANVDSSESYGQDNPVTMPSSIQSNCLDVCNNTPDEKIKRELEIVSESTAAVLQSVNEPTTDLLIPNYNFDFIHDTFFTQICSSWFDPGSFVCQFS